MRRIMCTFEQGTHGLIVLSVYDVVIGTCRKRAATVVARQSAWRIDRVIVFLVERLTTKGICARDIKTLGEPRVSGIPTCTSHERVGEQWCGIASPIPVVQ